jgi:hypothetical protein
MHHSGVSHVERVARSDPTSVRESHLEREHALEQLACRCAALARRLPDAAHLERPTRGLHEAMLLPKRHRAHDARPTRLRASQLLALGGRERERVDSSRVFERDLKRLVAQRVRDT